jgi:hypothetical protein
MRACHSWSGPFGQRHQTLRLEPGVTSLGVSAPFLVACHSFARAGSRRARLLAGLARRPEQNGHPWAWTRLRTVASHSWRAPFAHFHETLRSEPGATSAGVSAPFRRASHWTANAGNRSARERPGAGVRGRTGDAIGRAHRSKHAG